MKNSTFLVVGALVLISGIAIVAYMSVNKTNNTVVTQVGATPGILGDLSNFVANL